MRTLMFRVLIVSYIGIPALLLVFPGPCQAQFKYDLQFLSGPSAHTGWYDGKPAGKITATLKFGQLTCPNDYPGWCYYPEPGFEVDLHWVDPRIYPPCEVPIFEAMILGGSAYVWIQQAWWRCGFWDKKLVWGEGTIRKRHHGSCEWSYWLGGLYNYFQSGWSYFDVEAGPLCPGYYVMRLYTYQWPLSYEEMAGCEYMKDPDWYWESMSYVKVAEKRIYVPQACINPLRLHDLIGIDDGSFDPEGDWDTVYAEQALTVNHKYWLAVNLRTDVHEGMLPNFLVGELRPGGDGARDDLPITLFRWPEGDGRFCEGSPMKDYAYRTQEKHIPFDLWDLTPREWAGVFRPLDCNFSKYDNGTDNSLEERFYVVSDVALDCLNDTTVCFVPAKEECIDFIFYYCTSTGIDMTSEVTFYVKDNYDHLLYSQPVGVVNWPGPGSPSIYSVYLRWDGRNNLFSEGHLADPDNGPYHAWVEANVGPVLTTYLTSIEDFFVVPSIDSILLTHAPSYPPPGAGETTNLYAIIRGKVDDDALIPENNYRYYHAPDIFAPDILSVWDGGDHSYHFHDLPTGPPDPERQQYYFENNNTRILELREWNQYLWGPLTYNWFVYHDYRYRQYGQEQVLYQKIDTSGTWGHGWKVTLGAPRNWAYAQQIPYMRLLTAADIINNRNLYHVQDNMFAKDHFAHKVIFIEDTGPEGLDIVDWAISHVGVAYESWSGLEKNPYRRIECSGLVTATRVQEIWPRQDHNYRIGWILAKDYDRGQYSFRGQNLSLELESFGNLSQVGRRCLITFKEPGATVATHVAIVKDALYNERYHRFDYCHILNARGWLRNQPNIRFGRVRYDDLMRDFEPNDYLLKFLRFTN